MKALTVLAISAILVAAFAFSRTAFQTSTSAQQSNSSQQAKRESPIVCDTTALTPEVRKRHYKEVGPILISLRKSIHELPDGYEFEFTADDKTLQLVTEWASTERLCCPFYDISVRLEREGGPLSLRLTGREGVKDFIREGIAAWIKPMR